MHRDQIHMLYTEKTSNARFPPILGLGSFETERVRNK